MWCSQRMLADPPEFGLPRNHFNVGICFMQESRGFQSALSRTDDCHSLSRKLSYFPTLIAVNCLLRREVLEYGGLFPKRSNPRGDHNTKSSESPRRLGE